MDILLACVRRRHGGKQISTASHKKKKPHNQCFVKADIWAHSPQSSLGKARTGRDKRCVWNLPHKIRNRRQISATIKEPASRAKLPWTERGVPARRELCAAVALGRVWFSKEFLNKKRGFAFFLTARRKWRWSRGVCAAFRRVWVQSHMQLLLQTGWLYAWRW